MARDRIVLAFARQGAVLSADDVREDAFWWTCPHPGRLVDGAWLGRTKPVSALPHTKLGKVHSVSLPWWWLHSIGEALILLARFKGIGIPGLLVMRQRRPQEENDHIYFSRKCVCESLKSELQKMEGWREVALQLDQDNAKLRALSNLKLNPNLHQKTQRRRPTHPTTVIIHHHINSPFPASE